MTASQVLDLVDRLETASRYMRFWLMRHDEANAVVYARLAASYANTLIDLAEGRKAA